ncbi:MAG TPA: hypothetical protein VF483_00075 [Gemmatimonadaceae bacterium]
MKPTAAAFLIASCLACAGVGEKVDSAKVLPVNDMNARDTTAPPPPPPITRLSLLDSLPSGGVCSVKRYRSGADQAREIYYETTTPQRTYVIEIGKPPRLFLPVSLDIRGTQLSAGLTETENVFVGFTPSGSVSTGVRRYTSTGTTEANDRAPLNMSDSAQVLSFARKILEMCDTGR